MVSAAADLWQLPNAAYCDRVGSCFTDDAAIDVRHSILMIAGFAIEGVVTAELVRRGRYGWAAIVAMPALALLVLAAALVALGIGTLGPPPNLPALNTPELANITGGWAVGLIAASAIANVLAIRIRLPRRPLGGRIQSPRWTHLLRGFEMGLPALGAVVCLGAVAAELGYQLSPARGFCPNYGDDGMLGTWCFEPLISLIVLVLALIGAGVAGTATFLARRRSVLRAMLVEAPVALFAAWLGAILLWSPSPERPLLNTPPPGFWLDGFAAGLLLVGMAVITCAFVLHLYGALATRHPQQSTTGPAPAPSRTV